MEEEEREGGVREVSSLGEHNVMPRMTFRGVFTISPGGACLLARSLVFWELTRVAHWQFRDEYEVGHVCGWMERG